MPVKKFLSESSEETHYFQVEEVDLLPQKKYDLSQPTYYNTCKLFFMNPP